MDTIKSRSRNTPATVAIHADDRIAYIKPFTVEGRAGFAIHAADGTPIGWCEKREVAFAAVRQQDLEPVSVH